MVDSGYSLSSFLRTQTIRFFYAILSESLYAENQIYDAILQVDENICDEIVSGMKQGFKVYTTSGTFLGLLSPEYTWQAVQKMHNSSRSVYYISECFRNENTQKLRRKQFVQLGCEFVGHGLKKFNAVALLCLTHLKLLLIGLQLRGKLNIDCNSPEMQQAIRIIFENASDYGIILSFEDIHRDGNDINLYKNLTFEFHSKTSDETMHEIIGGGSYTLTKRSLYNTGYASGEERVLAAMEYASSNFLDIHQMTQDIVTQEMLGRREEIPIIIKVEKDTLCDIANKLNTIKLSELNNKKYKPIII